MLDTLKHIFEAVLYIAIPSDRLVLVALAFLGLVWLYSSYRIRSGPALRAQRVQGIGTRKPPESNTASRGKESAEWEMEYENRVSRELSLIAGLHHSDWRAILERNHTIVLQHFDQFRVVPNLLLLIGLLATIFGLAGTVARLGPSLVTALGAGDLSIMKQQLANAFSQLGAAFSGTFWGIIAALSFSLMYARKRSYVVERLQARDDMLIAKLSGMLPPSPGAYLQQLNVVTMDIKLVIQELKTIIDKFGPTMEEASAKFKGALDAAGNAIATSMDTLKAEATKIENTLNSAAKTLTSAVVEVSGVTNAIATAVTSLGNAHKELLRAVDSQFTMWHNHLEKVLHNTNALQNTFQKSSLEIVNQLLNLNDVMKISISKMDIALEEFAKAKLELVDMLKKHYGDAADKVETALSAGIESVKGIEETFESLVQDTLSQIEATQNAFRNLVSTSSEILGCIDLASDEVKKAMHDVSEGTNKLREILTELSGHVKRFEEGSRSLTEHASSYRLSIESLIKAANLLQDTVPKFTDTIQLLAASARRNGRFIAKRRFRMPASRGYVRRVGSCGKRASEANRQEKEVTPDEP